MAVPEAAAEVATVAVLEAAGVRLEYRAIRPQECQATARHIPLRECPAIARTSLRQGRLAIAHPIRRPERPATVRAIQLRGRLCNVPFLLADHSAQRQQRLCSVQRRAHRAGLPIGRRPLDPVWAPANLGLDPASQAPDPVNPVLGPVSPAPDPANLE